MTCYQFFNNSTIAAVIAVVIGTRIAIWQYKRQKNIDFIEKQKLYLINLLASLNLKIEETRFILERLAYTYKFIEEKLLERKNLSSFKDEIFRMGNLINEDIPLLNKKIDLFLNLYFKERENLKVLYDDYKNNLKNWHNFVLTNYKNWIGFIEKNKKIPPQLETQDINDSINKLIREIRDI